MFDTFTLKIELGNAAMKSGPDVARALRAVADRIENGLEARGSIRDDNGNTVGTYGPTDVARRAQLLAKLRQVRAAREVPAPGPIQASEDVELRDQLDGAVQYRRPGPE